MGGGGRSKTVVSWDVGCELRPKTIFFSPNLHCSATSPEPFQQCLRFSAAEQLFIGLAIASVLPPSRPLNKRYLLPWSAFSQGHLYSHKPPVHTCTASINLPISACVRSRPRSVSFFRLRKKADLCLPPSDGKSNHCHYLCAVHTTSPPPPPGPLAGGP